MQPFVAQHVHSVVGGADRANVNLDRLGQGRAVCDRATSRRRVLDLAPVLAHPPLLLVDFLLHQKLLAADRGLIHGKALQRFRTHHPLLPQTQIHPKPRTRDRGGRGSCGRSRHLLRSGS